MTDSTTVQKDKPKSDAEIRMDMAKLGYVVQMDGTITKPNGDPLTERTWVHPDHWVISLRRLERARKWK